MDVEKSSAPCAGGRDSTQSITANQQNVRQMACVLLCDEEPVSMALLGEPLMEAMLMVAWCLDHEHEPDFRPERVLPAWARKRKRGAWREHRMPEIEQFLDTINCRVDSMWQCAACSGRFREEPYEAQEGNGTFYAGDTLCADCAKRHGAA